MRNNNDDSLTICFIFTLIFLLGIFLGRMRLNDLKQTVCLNSTETPIAYQACMAIEFEDMKSRLIFDDSFLGGM